MKHRAGLLLFALTTGLLMMLTALFLARSVTRAIAAPIPPPEGYPKLSISMMTVSPTLANVGGARLEYVIEIINTGAYTAGEVILTNVVPTNTVYNNDALASSGADPIFAAGTLSWTGEIGFDNRVAVSYSVNVLPAFEGVVKNTAVITQAQITRPVTVSAETVVTDDPILELAKISSPAKPGPNKPLTYQLSVTNVGQPAAGLPITVTDPVPANTTLSDVGPDGSADAADSIVTWSRSLSLSTGAATVFTFTVTVDDVVSGTVLENANYNLSSELGIVDGTPYTTTVIDPILYISKSTLPDPAGSNRTMTYTISVLNLGSLATNLVITDVVPPDVDYLSGGSFDGTSVSWTLPKLDTNEVAQVSFVVSINDIAGVFIANESYQVCSAEGVCALGSALNSLILGPTFEAAAALDPVAKKPGGGTGPVTPTLTVHNLGPGSALAATAKLSFGRISVNLSDLIAIPDRGTFSSGPGCGENCKSYLWVGDIAAGETITFTTLEGQSTIGGDEGNIYSATITITDTLGLTNTLPVRAEADGHVTHLSNLIPSKTAPLEIAAGQVMTYQMTVYNSGLSTDVPPYPTVTDTIPLSTTLVEVGPGGEVFTVANRTAVSFTLPALGPGESMSQWFSVRVDPGLVSGTLIVNDDYRSRWFNLEGTGVYSSNTGVPFTTTVKEIGLIDSFKTVSPTLLMPGIGNELTYTIHVVNSSPMPLQGVVVNDLMPWQHSTYSRDAVASAGQIISDIVSLSWIGDVGAYSEELITFTLGVDDFFEGPLTNTATITHSTLMTNVVVQAVAYITDDPVLKITKTASPDPVVMGKELLYTIYVANLGQQATGLVVTDTVPSGVVYIAGSASSGGVLAGGLLRWEVPVLTVGETRTFTFRVKVNDNRPIVNELYQASCAEGVFDWGEPVVTEVIVPYNGMFLPIINRFAGNR
ncbi:MAG: DUF11 domain-containing protein [Chloroflexota bacterium]|nr:MAG: DUF11 domain-containing protein [Chloroflexota bacterium]